MSDLVNKQIADACGRLAAWTTPKVNFLSLFSARQTPEQLHAAVIVAAQHRVLLTRPQLLVILVGLYGSAQIYNLVGPTKILWLYIGELPI